MEEATAAALGQFLMSVLPLLRNLIFQLNPTKKKMEIGN